MTSIERQFNKNMYIDQGGGKSVPNIYLYTFLSFLEPKFGKDDGVKAIMTNEHIQVEFSACTVPKTSFRCSSCLYRVFFFTGPPPKKFKYGKPRLGEARCI